MATAIITITFTDDDVTALAETYGVPTAVALERAEDWAKAIADYATTEISDRLASVIQHDQP